MLFLSPWLRFLFLVDSELDEVWEESTEESDHEAINEPCKERAPSLPTFQNDSEKKQVSLVKWLVGFLFFFQAKFYLPDPAINVLLKFIRVLFSTIGKFSPFVKSLNELIPKSFDVMVASSSKQLFTKYVVCRHCLRLYEYSSCIDKVSSSQHSKRCMFVKYPHHSQRARRQPCNSLLLKNVEVASKKSILYPFKVYCYRSLKHSLEQLFLRDSFFELCEHWKDRIKHSANVMEDVYDGAIWKEFEPVFRSTFCIALMLNVDWFQPYTHTVSSVGVVYLTIMNLPRHLRSKLENMILVGIIPGPNEPKHDINTFLEPLVEELLHFWKGVSVAIRTNTGIEQKVVRCALTCVSCDLPAMRKVCGFLSHSAALGCSKCMKLFSGSVGSMDYSGFDRSAWPKRTNQSHRENVQKLKNCNNKTEQSKLESEIGSRYSVLLDLPYFDPVCMHIIDPMHNLFLGSGKHMVQVWMNSGFLTSSHCDKIQEVVDGINVPSDIGRIPMKIQSGFSGFKADQFKNWINLFSAIALFDILPTNILQSWRYFVLVCRILCKQQLSLEDINLADALLLQFCKKVEDTHGNSAITPNMHMHGHLKEVILNYGPLQEFWCYSFERYNGILGKQPTNNRNIEPQLLKKFLRIKASYDISYPDMFKEEFEVVLTLLTSSKMVGSLSEIFIDKEIKLPSNYFKAVLSAEDKTTIETLVANMHSSEAIHVC